MTDLQEFPKDNKIRTDCYEVDEQHSSSYHSHYSILLLMFVRNTIQISRFFTWFVAYEMMEPHSSFCSTPATLPDS